jgi:hypothetical protein
MQAGMMFSVPLGKQFSLCHYPTSLNLPDLSLTNRPQKTKPSKKNGLSWVYSTRWKLLDLSQTAGPVPFNSGLGKRISPNLREGV